MFTRKLTWVRTKEVGNCAAISDSLPYVITVRSVITICTLRRRLSKKMIWEAGNRITAPDTTTGRQSASRSRKFATARVKAPCICSVCTGLKRKDMCGVSYTRVQYSTEPAT